MASPNTSQQIRIENSYKNRNVSQIEKRQFEIMYHFMNMSGEVFVNPAKEVKATESGNDVDLFKELTRRLPENQVWHTGNGEVRGDNERRRLSEEIMNKRNEYGYF